MDFATYYFNQGRKALMIGKGTKDEFFEKKIQECIKQLDEYASFSNTIFARGIASETYNILKRRGYFDGLEICDQSNLGRLATALNYLASF